VKGAQPLTFWGFLRSDVYVYLFLSFFFRFELLQEFSVEADDEQGKFRHIAELTILTVQLIVEFSKRLPGFDTLLREDQITLLKVLTLALSSID
jgi:hypothetical protein